jgi:hypothetical protein
MHATTAPQPPTTTSNATPGAIATFLVATDRGDDPASAATLELGLQLAREAGARVVLYDRSAESSFTDPFEAPKWAGGQLPTWEQLLSPPQLRHLGYGYLAEQLSYAQAMGLDAVAWLPFGVGPAVMGRCVAAWGVTQVVLPAKVANPSVWARLRGRTLADFQANLPGVEILLVSPDGRLQQITSRLINLQPMRTGALV